MANEVIIRFNAKGLEKAKQDLAIIRKSFNESIKNIEDKDLRFALKKKFAEQQKIEREKVTQKTRNIERLRKIGQEISPEEITPSGRAFRQGFELLGKAKSISAGEIGSLPGIATSLLAANPAIAATIGAALFGLNEFKKFVDDKVDEAVKARDQAIINRIEERQIRKLLGKPIETDPLLLDAQSKIAHALELEDERRGQGRFSYEGGKISIRGEGIPGF